MPTLQFKIQLQNIANPPVWRRVVVQDDITLDDFHLIIQAVFGWENYHMYQFSPKGWGSRPIFQPPVDDYDDGPGKIDSSTVGISEVFTAAGQKYTYIYDFGDDWKHVIQLEKILDEKIIGPLCTAGKGACPPEDCGGPFGYLILLETLADPKHPDHKEMRSWLGLGRSRQWDVDAFDINIANARIRELEDNPE